MSASNLGRALRQAGFTVDDNAALGRSSTWSGPRFVMWHHTVSSEDPNAIRNVVNFARTGTAHPPIYHIIVDVRGHLWMICRERSGQREPGRASHAGAGGPFMGVGADRMNEVSIGISAQHRGDRPIAANAVQYATMVRLSAFLCRRYSIPVANVIGHKEWTPRKVDPRDNMRTVRTDVQKAMGGGNPGTPAPPPGNEGRNMDRSEVVRTGDGLRVGEAWQWLTFTAEVRDSANIHFRDGIFSVAGRKFDIVAGFGLRAAAPARVSIQAVVTNQSHVITAQYPAQSFQVGPGIVTAHHGSWAGFCPRDMRVRLRVRSLDAPTQVTANVTVTRW